MKNINIFIVFCSIFLLEINKLFAADIKANDIIPTTTDQNLIQDTSGILSVFSSAKTIIFTVVSVVAVAMFLYTWFQVIMSFWKPDEFKKAFKTFLYTIIWLVIVALAYALVSMFSAIVI